MAVLPTPAWPTNNGLFLRRLDKICTVLKTSSSLPRSGSISPRRAFSQRFVVKDSREDGFVCFSLPTFFVSSTGASAN